MEIAILHRLTFQCRICCSSRHLLFSKTRYRVNVFFFGLAQSSCGRKLDVMSFSWCKFCSMKIWISQIQLFHNLFILLFCTTKQILTCDWCHLKSSNLIANPGWNEKELVKWVIDLFSSPDSRFPRLSPSWLGSQRLECQAALILDGLITSQKYLLRHPTCFECRKNRIETREPLVDQIQMETALF